MKSMRIVFAGWKYIFENIWYVLPFAIVPGVFLALCVDFSSLSTVVHGFFTGNPNIDFVTCFRAWSFLRIDSWLGGIYTACAFLACAIFLALILTFIEKHMRIGKRTLSGMLRQFASILPSAFLMTLCYFVFYEVWVVVLSALLHLVSALHSTAVVYILYILVLGLLTMLLVYLSTLAYLFLPCKQITGFGFGDAFLYAYYLLIKVRRPLLLSMLLSLVVLLAVFIGISFLPVYIFRIVAVVLYLLAFMSFTVRMETTYFTADKLDREDRLKSYREL